VDDLTNEQLGDYDIVPIRHLLPSIVLFDISVDGLMQAITNAVDKVEPLASFVPGPIRNLLVENAASRRLPPNFPEVTIMGINLLGLPTFEDAGVEGESEILSTFPQAISLINAEVEARSGVMKKVTYHMAGPDILVMFGVPNSHTNDSVRAAHAALAIRDIIERLDPITIANEKLKVTCHIGMTRGRVFAAEFGETQGKREFNVMGYKVNMATHLMHKAQSDKILFSKDVLDTLENHFVITGLGKIPLKEKSANLPLYALEKSL
jgi:hypothetical protein